MHLPPIVPSTPSIGNAKKILRKGNEIANANYSMDMHSPQPARQMAAFSPDYSPLTPVRMPAHSRSNSISPLPGVSENEVEDFEARKALEKYHTPQHSQSKPVSSFKGSLSAQQAQAQSHPSSRHAEPKQLLFASQSDRDLQESNQLSLSSSSH